MKTSACAVRYYRNSIKMKAKTLIGELIAQFQARHHRSPKRVVVHPIASVVLGARKELPVKWQGIPVVCMEFDRSILPKTGDKLGIYANLKAVPPCLCACDID